jgi:type IX secretion system PorP/SprF family membrane protein
MKSNMKKLTLILAFLAVAAVAQAQLGTPLAQYSGNQLIYNPGYAGIHDLFSANLSVRKLWVGLPGSPSLISLNAHAPFQSQQNALGFVYQQERWGPMIGNIVHTTYAHKVNLGTHTLSLGLQAGFLNNIIDWDRIEYVMDDDDPGLGYARTSTTSLDVNVGAYYQTPRFYAGFSVKHLTMPKFARLTLEDTGEEWYSQQRMQFFLLGGYNFILSDEWSVRPEMLVRYVRAMPLSVDIGINVVYLNRFFLGTAFHTGQRAVSLTLKGEVKDGIRVGYSYDIHFGRIRQFQRGSHEISINYFMPLWNREERIVGLVWL